jgi:hypothetical protein
MVLKGWIHHQMDQTSHWQALDATRDFNPKEDWRAGCVDSLVVPTPYERGLIGISLPVRNCGNEEFHEIQFWEDVIEPIQFAHTSVATYDWLMTRLRSRATNQMLPIYMPEKFENLSVIQYRTGKDGRILFT